MSPAKKLAPRTTADLISDHLVCRRGGLGHAWDDNPNPILSRGPVAQAASYFLAKRCLRCTAECVKYLDSRGLTIGNPHYHYPVGYSASRLSPLEVTQELIHRSLLVQRLELDDQDRPIVPKRRKPRKGSARASQPLRVRRAG